MANRSYLYSADSLPTPAAGPTPPIRCISEHNWSVPLAHKVLVSSGTRVVESILFGNPIGIAADYTAGTELLLGLLRVVGEGELRDREWFDRGLQKAEEHLKLQHAKYFLLETGELLQERSEFQSLVDHEIPSAAKLAQSIIAGGERTQLTSLRADWHQHFDTFYSDFLYFSFPQD